MPYCAHCNEDFEGELTSCPNCGQDFDEESETDWVPIAKIVDKTSADFVSETLASYSIPNTIISESGFFGQAGLNLPSLSGKGIGKFLLYIPEEFEEEVVNILNMILGNRWEKIENLPED